LLTRSLAEGHHGEIECETSRGRVALYGKLIATNARIERKGDANPYTSVNGNMFTLLHESRLAIPLPEAKRENS